MESSESKTGVKMATNLHGSSTSSKIKKSSKTPQIVAAAESSIKVAKTISAANAVNSGNPQPSSGSLHVVCLRLTLIFCIGAATVGFCLLIAGGVGRHMEEMKMLMYIGIMIFLVSVALLVIMCSTWGTGGHYHMVQRPAHQFLYPIKPTAAEHMMYSCPKTYINKGYPLPFHCPYPVPSPTTNSRAFDPRLNGGGISSTIGHKPDPKPCSVKNCVCQVRNSEDCFECQPPFLYQMPLAPLPHPQTDWLPHPSYRMHEPQQFYNNTSSLCSKSYNNNVNVTQNNEATNLSWERDGAFIMNPQTSLPNAYSMSVGEYSYQPTHNSGVESITPSSPAFPNCPNPKGLSVGDESSML